MKTPAWTQEELARRVGVHPRDLHKYETGKAGLSFAMALRIVRALGRTVEEVFWGHAEAADELLGARSRALAASEPTP